jgi:hypothetical protein
VEEVVCEGKAEEEEEEVKPHSNEPKPLKESQQQPVASTSLIASEPNPAIAVDRPVGEKLHGAVSGEEKSVIPAECCSEESEHVERLDAELSPKSTDNAYDTSNVNSTDKSNDLSNDQSTDKSNEKSFGQQQKTLAAAAIQFVAPTPPPRILRCAAIIPTPAAASMPESFLPESLPSELKMSEDQTQEARGESEDKEEEEGDSSVDSVNLLGLFQEDDERAPKDKVLSVSGLGVDTALNCKVDDDNDNDQDEEDVNAEDEEDEEEGVVSHADEEEKAEILAFELRALHASVYCRIANLHIVLMF